MSKYYWWYILKKLSLTDGLEIATLETVVLWEKVLSSSWLSSLKIQELNSFDIHIFPTPTSQVFR